MSAWTFCPQCAAPLSDQHLGGMLRRACSAPDCSFVHWDNPVPVVAAVVEYEGRILLARNVAWTHGAFALVTGFLEKGEVPETGVLREVEEEVGLVPQAANYIGMYEHHRMNQLLIAFHVPATGTIQLNEELAEYRLVEFGDCTYWPAGTGYALRDFLRARGHDPQEIPLFRPRD